MRVIIHPRQPRHLLLLRLPILSCLVNQYCTVAVAAAICVPRADDPSMHPVCGVQAEGSARISALLR
jgi:hypothetical protein